MVEHAVKPMSALGKQLNEFSTLLERFGEIPATPAPPAEIPVDEDLLNEFRELLRRLPATETKPFTTFLEIADFPRSELAYSKILEFFSMHVDDILINFLDFVDRHHCLAYALFEGPC